MKSDKYWKMRKARRMVQSMEHAERSARTLKKVYEKAYAFIMSRAENIFDNYKRSDSLTEAEAIILLKSIDLRRIKDIEQQLMAIGTAEALNAVKILRNTGAYGFRLERLERLFEQINSVMKDVYHAEVKEVTGVLKKIAKESYTKNFFDLQKRINVGFEVTNIDPKHIQKVLDMNWSGKHYSERIWENTERVAEAVEEQMLEGILTGKSELDMAKDIHTEFQKGEMNSRRLVRTESAHVNGQIDLESYKDAEIERYMFLAVLDLKTSKKCRELDGKIFYVDDEEEGVNYPPMHPWCRSTTIEVIEEDYIKKMKRRYRDPVTKRNEIIPEFMTYQEWYEKYVPEDVKKKDKNRIKS